MYVWPLKLWWSALKIKNCSEPNIWHDFFILIFDKKYVLQKPNVINISFTLVHFYSARFYRLRSKRDTNVMVKAIEHFNSAIPCQWIIHSISKFLFHFFILRNATSSFRFYMMLKLIMTVPNFYNTKIYAMNKILKLNVVFVSEMLVFSYFLPKYVCKTINSH